MSLADEQPPPAFRGHPFILVLGLVSAPMFGLWILLQGTALIRWAWPELLGRFGRRAYGLIFAPLLLLASAFGLNHTYETELEAVRPLVRKTLIPSYWPLLPYVEDSVRLTEEWTEFESAHPKLVARIRADQKTRGKLAEEGVSLRRAEAIAKVKAWPSRYVFARLEALAYVTYALVFLAPFWVFSGRWFHYSAPARRPDTHGSSYWRSGQNGLPRNGQTSSGLMLGLVPKKKTPLLRDRRYRTHQHLLTVAPTGAGKGVGCVIPNLLEYPGSAVVLDLKGELYATTARARREMGQEVRVFDPFAITDAPEAERASLNPLAYLDVEDPDADDHADLIADALVLSQDPRAAHWDETAKALIKAMVLFAASMDEADCPKDLTSVRALLTHPEFSEMLDVLIEDTELAGGTVSRIAATQKRRPPAEGGSILSSACRHTEFLENPRLVAALSSSSQSLDLRRLKTQPTTVYLCIPPNRMKRCARVLRLLFSTVIAHGLEGVRGLPQHPVLLLLDEFAKLGRFPLIAEQVSITRSFGGRIWCLVQDLSQLESLYPEWTTFPSNMTVQAFGLQDLKTCEWVSKMLGSYTSVYMSRSDPGALFVKPGSPDSSRLNETRTSRPLLTPDEIRRMPSNLILVLERDAAPLHIHRLDYRRDPWFRGKFDANPVYSWAVDA